MKTMPPNGKYVRHPLIQLQDRTWPSHSISRAPTLCSVCLRDGNQALAQPMTIDQKLELFHAIVECGFDEIEVGFPSASPTEFAFNRRIITEGLIPDNVTIQCLVQARKDLILKTAESLEGARRAIIHLYNSTSPAQRRVVFRKSQSEIIALAVSGAQMVMDQLQFLKQSDIRIEYTPESFSLTEVPFAVEVCKAVMDVVQPTAARPIILNLPDTVQVSMPNVYADQIELFIRMMLMHWPRKCFIISLHTHNDRGTGVAATEMGILAGAERVEGTLFGNGERTGNLDLVTLAMNLYMHGVDPGLDLRELGKLADVYTRCTGMVIPQRQPYAGELVFTAFSGSHQDAIKKGLAEWPQREGKHPWDVPYLAIDPRDIGRDYTEVVRVNSQSGKGGVSYLLEQAFGIKLPKELQVEFGAIVTELVDGKSEASPDQLRLWLYQRYRDCVGPYSVDNVEFKMKGNVKCKAVLTVRDQTYHIRGEGVGIIASFGNALSRSRTLPAFKVEDYSEHALAKGANAEAVCYVLISVDGQKFWGIGTDANIEQAPIKAIVSALNSAALSQME